MPSFADANSVLSGFVSTDSAEEPKIKALTLTENLAASTIASFKDGIDAMQRSLLSEKVVDCEKVAVSHRPRELLHQLQSIPVNSCPNLTTLTPFEETASWEKTRKKPVNHGVFLSAVERT